MPPFFFKKHLRSAGKFSITRLKTVFLSVWRVYQYFFLKLRIWILLPPTVCPVYFGVNLSRLSQGFWNEANLPLRLQLTFWVGDGKRHGDQQSHKSFQSCEPASECMVKIPQRTERDESQIDFSYTGDIKSKKSDSSKGQDTHMGCYSLTAKEFDQEKFQCLSF